MAFLDIENIINQDNIGSRFKLVYLAGMRAKELNAPSASTVLQEVRKGDKVTSKALTDIVKHRVDFSIYSEEEASEKDEMNEEEATLEPTNEPNGE